MKNSPASTDKNPGNASKSGPSPGTRAFEALKGVRPTKPTPIKASLDPQGGPAVQLKHHAVSKAGDEKPKG
jgi:hypothetical protein